EGVDFSALVSSALTGATNIGLSNITTDTNGTIHVTATNNTGADLSSGAALLTFTMATTQDSVAEATETFTVTLASTTASVTTPTVTTSIIDNDTSTIALSQAQATVAEGATTGTYTVSLSGGVGLGAGDSVTFTLDSASGTATEGVDFSALVSSALTGATNIGLSNITTDTNGTIHVTATNNTGADLSSGAALLTFTMATTQDSVAEATETFTVTLASTTASVTTPTVTTSIIDNDTSTIALS